MLDNSFSAESLSQAEAARIDEEHRLRDFNGWLADKKRDLEETVERLKSRKEKKAQLGDRKSLAAQQRMKTITDMASDKPVVKKKRKKGENEDTFGADDEDWQVYREIVSNCPLPRSTLTEMYVITGRRRFGSRRR